MIKYDILFDAIDEDKYETIEEQNETTPMPYDTGVINPNNS